mgnify:CR=1 FL=1
MAEPLLKKHWEHDSTITMDPLSIDPIQPGRFEQHRVLAIIGSGPVGVTVLVCGVGYESMAMKLQHKRRLCIIGT